MNSLVPGDASEYNVGAFYYLKVFIILTANPIAGGFGHGNASDPICTRDLCMV
jgi:hypothetical protein